MSNELRDKLAYEHYQRRQKAGDYDHLDEVLVIHPVYGDFCYGWDAHAENQRVSGITPVPMEKKTREEWYESTLYWIEAYEIEHEIRTENQWRLVANGGFPRDGTHVDLWLGRTDKPRRLTDCYFDAENSQWRCRDGENINHSFISHYRILEGPKE